MLDDVTILPDFSDQQAARLAQDLFDLDGSLSRLDGERDLNFLVAGARSAVFKISHHEERWDMLDCQNQVFERLAGNTDLGAPRAIQSVNGIGIEQVTADSGRQHYCRAVEYIPGQLYSAVSHVGDGLHRDLGAYLGRLDLALEGFSHSGLERPLLWQMEHALDVTDWMYLMENGTIMNRSEMRKFGIKVAELIATIRPADPTTQPSHQDKS